jgi:Histidine phosphatase superfamily (branch 1)
MPISVVRLFLVRHAEALANPDLRYLGSRDDPLTELGQWQAIQLAQAFAAFELQPSIRAPLREHCRRQCSWPGCITFPPFLTHAWLKPRWGHGKACVEPKFSSAALRMRRSINDGRPIQALDHPAASRSLMSRYGSWPACVTWSTGIRAHLSSWSATSVRSKPSCVRPWTFP